MSAARLLELHKTSAVDTAGASWERQQIVDRLGAQFQVVRELGRGGVGVVFLARDVALHRLVAIKVLRREYAASSEHRERFRREARLTARLSHSGIVPVYAFGEAGDFVYIVMKYVHGESLADRMRRDGRLSAAETQRILRELALALDAAHGDGVVHRDLKPENILLERGSDRAMITDFGVALLRSLDPVRADARRAFGTPHYMSPEQAAGELDIDGRSDVYSLGVLGYHMLSGTLPFDGRTFEMLAAMHIAAAPRPLAELVPSAPGVLVDAIGSCLAKDRDDRPRNGAEVAQLLDGAKFHPRSRSRLSRVLGGQRAGGVGHMALLLLAALKTALDSKTV